jgi:hypothetical protein
MGKNGERTAVVLDEQPLWLEAMGQLLDRVGMRVVGKTADLREALDLVVSKEREKRSYFELITYESTICPCVQRN